VPPRGSRELVFVKSADFTVRKLKLAGQLAGKPAVSGPNLLVPLHDGSIQCLSIATGEATAAPFLLASGAGFTSTAVTVVPLDESGKEALVSDGTTSLVRIGLVAEPKPHWVEQAAVRLPQPLAAPAVGLAELTFAVDGRGAVHMFSLPDLNAAQPIDLKGGRLTWGPHRAGDCVLLATDRDELWCFDPARQPRWQQPLAAGQLVGPPRLRDNKLILTTSSGQIEVRAASSGDITANVQLPQPLAGSSLLSGNTLWLTTTFGQVLQVAIPTEPAK
jgi:outer membrane protein assembly factor BamB